MHGSPNYRESVARVVAVEVMLPAGCKLECLSGSTRCRLAG